MSQYLTNDEIAIYCTSQLGVTLSDVKIASELIDGYCKTSFCVNETEESVKVNRKSRGKLRHGRVVDVLEVKEMFVTPLGSSKVDGNVNDIDLDLENDGYFTYLAPYSPFIGLGYGCGCRSMNKARNITVKYTYGFSEIPEDIKIVTAMLAQNIRQFNTFAGFKKLTTLDYTVEMGNASFFTNDMRNILDKYKE
mgnify:CR=1 FL=1